MIKLENLNKSFHDGERELTIINNLSFTFPQSGTVAILGKSGVGKSTLLYLLGGLERPTTGQIFYSQKNISTLDSETLASIRRNYVGFVFQSHQLLGEFSAIENVALPLLIAGVKEKEALKEAKVLLTRVGLEHRLHHRPGQLSGGEQQRAAIARAIVTKPQLVLADEPTGNLDVATAKEVQDLIFAIQKEIKALMVLVTHNRELALACELCLEMQQGGDLVKVCS